MRDRDIDVDSIDFETASAQARVALNRFYSNIERTEATNMVFLAGKLDILPIDMHPDGSFTVAYEEVDGSINTATFTRPR